MIRVSEMQGAVKRRATSLTEEGTFGFRWILVIVSILRKRQLNDPN